MASPSATARYGSCPSRTNQSARLPTASSPIGCPSAWAPPSSAASYKARQSSTSFCCSATWIWIGQVLSLAPSTSAICSGVTARSEWKHSPSACAGCSASNGASCCCRRRYCSVELMKRRCPSLGAWPPKPAWLYKTGSSVRPMPLAPAAALMRRDSSAGSA
ncbi:hypothetical protein WR25_04871 [Diploscapter pachys]|uniref:Uncharacterized protein n=1 Tax=Diploscapter pachys TaxID=2018661 RepID=A0A2A2K8R4_9BILA|nr:hypothetical protein WR25_04871 [Diploscapter pachys]